MKYEVTYAETLSKTVFVYADSKREAFDMVRDMADKGDIVLDGGDFESYDIFAFESDAVDLETLFEIIEDELLARVKEDFKPGEGAYRVDEGGYYVSVADWDNVFNKYAKYYREGKEGANGLMLAWMFWQNRFGCGRKTLNMIEKMSREEIEEALNKTGLEVCFYTEADADGSF